MLLSAIPVLASLSEKETIEFYTRKAGFSFHSSWDGYIILSRDGIFLHLWPCNDAEIPKQTGCYIHTDNANELYAEYEPLGIVHPNGKLEEKPWGMRQFSILDNNGNIIHFGQNISEAG